jgi:hypothetical protein
MTCPTKMCLPKEKNKSSILGIELRNGFLCNTCNRCSVKSDISVNAVKSNKWEITLTRLIRKKVVLLHKLPVGLQGFRCAQRMKDIWVFRQQILKRLQLRRTGLQKKNVIKSFVVTEGL